jgi:DNA polymerase III subunit alpha
MFDFEDAEGMIRSICWPDLFATCEPLVKPDNIVVIRGAVDKRPGSEEANLIVNEIIPLDELSGRFTRGMQIRVDEAENGPAKLQQLYEILRGYPGRAELQLELHLADGSRISCACDRLALNITPEMRSRIDTLLGPGHVRLLTASSRNRP